MPTKLHAAARDLAARGIPVFPIRPGTKFPAFKGAFYNSSTDPKQIDAWWAQADWNIGICPEQAGWAVIDVDVKGDGEATLAALETEHGRLPDTLTVRTPSGGRHLYFQGSLPASQNKSGLGAGLDTRGKASYVLAPPSQVAGTDYYVDRGRAPAALPDWVAATLQRRDHEKRTVQADTPTDTDAAIEQARAILAKEPVPGPDGEGDDYALFGLCKDRGVSQEKLLELCLERGADPVDEEWLEFTIKNAWKYGQNEPGSDYRDPAAKLQATLPDHTYKRLIKADPRPVGELIPGLVERHRISYLVGAGGTHKSRIAAHWGLAVHAGLPVYGRPVEKAHFVHLSWENGCDEDARRAQAIIRKIALPDGADFASAGYRDLCDDPRPLVIVTEDAVSPTPLWWEIAASLDDIPGHKFVVIDSLYNALHFVGQAKIDELAVKNCINWLDQMCRKHDFSGLMLQHPSAQGRQAGHAGYSEAWNNAPRVRLNIALAKGSTDVYELKVSKRNNAVAGGSKLLAWADGILEVKSESMSATDERDMLGEAAVALAFEFAKQGHPITQASSGDRYQPNMLDKLEFQLGYRPAKEAVLRALSKATGGEEGKLFYYSSKGSNDKNRAGYYPWPGPGGKGFD